MNINNNLYFIKQINILIIFNYMNEKDVQVIRNKLKESICLKKIIGIRNSWVLICFIILYKL